MRKNGDEMVQCFSEIYEQLLATKIGKLKVLIPDEFSHVNIEQFDSSKSHYRMRANFNIWRDKKNDDSIEGMYYAMFNEHKEAVEITSFPRGSVRMNNLMQNLMLHFKDYDVLRKKLFEVRFLTTSVDEAVIVLIYKSPLDHTWTQAANQLAKYLNAKIIGRSRKQMVVCGCDLYSQNESGAPSSCNLKNERDESIREVLTVLGKKLTYFQTEGAFSQPNACVCEKMLEWAVDVTRGSENEDLLELYCGGGTFTLALAGNFRDVLATEMNKISVQLATRAIATNQITNIKIARLSSEEFTQAYEKSREFNRLSIAGINISNYDFSTVLVDPPRAGLDTATCNLLSKFNKIVYISCNPDTLVRDLRHLLLTHSIERLAAFDQFPYTDHLECGVFLKRRVDNSLSTVDTEEAKPVHSSACTKGSMLVKRSLESAAVDTNYKKLQII